MAACLAAIAGAQSATSKNLEITATAVSHAPRAALNDCPPGANTVSATAKPGEEFAVVSIAMKVLPGYQPVPLKRPTLVDTTGKTYNTAVSFVDIGKVPEFTCAIPFRVPAGTKAKSLQVDSMTLDLAALDR
jgi:hypothetical protein